MNIDRNAIQSQLMDWLDHQTQDYDLVYLDPLICDDEVRRATGLHMPPRDRVARNTGALLRHLGGAVYNKAVVLTPTRYLEDNGVGTKVKSNRSLQRRISEVVKMHCSKGNLRHFTSLDSMKSQKTELHGGADKGPGVSLVVLDTMFATRAYLPSEITRTILLPPQHRNGSVRTLQGVLTDLPGSLVTMGDQILPLLMDERAISRWTPGFDTLMSAGWYPAVRVVGLYRTTTCGHGYVDVIALLARPWPTLNELVAGSSSVASEPDLPQILDNVRTHYVTPILDDLTATNPGTVAPGTPPPGNQIDFISYKELLAPPLFFQVFGYLNGASAKTLRTRAYRAHKALAEYLEALKRLEPYLDEHSQELRVIVEIDKLLPEPLYVRQSIRAVII